MSAPSFEQVVEARRVVNELVGDSVERWGWGDEHVAGLIEAKRQLGIAISERWSDRLAQVLEEQG